MTNDETSTNVQRTKQRTKPGAHDSDFAIPSPLGIRHSSFAVSLIDTNEQLSKLLQQVAPHQRLAVDTEADSLHCYREKLCLLQISSPESDYIIDPLADLDLAPLTLALMTKEIVLHGADFDLRLLRRSLKFVASRIFDTVIAARLLGIRQFSLAALVERYFGVKLPKGSQRANWARRPLPRRMAEYAVNDTHYLLSLAEKLEVELEQRGRMEWFRQSCQRAIQQAAISRTRDPDEVWRIRGAGALRGKAAAMLRALWRWREQEAEAADRPAFHILRNEELLRAAESFAAGRTPDYRHFSARRRRAFRAAAERALELPESEWPVPPVRTGTRPSSDTLRRSEELRARRDRAAHELEVEANVLAPRATLEAIATEETRAETLLLPWQRILLGV
jgi:ribonuclease D